MRCWAAHTDRRQQRAGDVAFGRGTDDAIESAAVPDLPAGGETDKRSNSGRSRLRALWCVSRPCRACAPAARSTLRHPGSASWVGVCVCRGADRWRRRLRRRGDPADCAGVLPVLEGEHTALSRPTVSQSRPTQMHCPPRTHLYSTSVCVWGGGVPAKQLPGCVCSRTVGWWRQGSSDRPAARCRRLA